MAPSRGWRRLTGPLILIVVLAAVPAVFDAYWLNIFTVGMALAIVYLSYTLVAGEGGIISLAQVTFAGIGAFAAARFCDPADTWHLGIPVWAAILVAALVAVPFGLLLALPSLRIGDLYLALLTVGFALLVQEFVWKRVEFENFGAGRLLARPFGISLDQRTAMYAVVTAVFLVCALVIVNLRRATSGLVFAAIRSSETASATTGISVVRAKLVLFAVSAFVAGLGGALLGSTIGTVTPRSFDVLVGVVWLAIIVTWGVRSVTGALLAGILFAVAPFKIAAILILTLLLAVGGVSTRLVISRAYRRPGGAALLVVVVAVGTAVSVRMWDRTSDVTAVHVILVLLVAAVGLTLARRARRAAPSTVAGWTTAAVVAVATVAVATWTATWSLAPATVHEVPTVLFGLGAIGLAREPRGVIQDLVDRQRLRRLLVLERREEDAELEAARVTS